MKVQHVWPLAFLLGSLLGCAEESTAPTVPDQPVPVSLSTRIYAVDVPSAVTLIANALTAEGFSIVVMTPSAGFVQAHYDVPRKRWKDFTSAIFLGYPKSRTETVASAQVTAIGSKQAKIELTIQDFTLDTNARPIETRTHSDPRAYESVWSTLDKGVPQLPQSTSPTTPVPATPAL